MPDLRLLYLTSAAISLLPSLPTAASALTIAADGQARAVVVTSAEATDPERHAAQELCAYLSRATGAEFVAQDQYDPQRPCILVGPDAAAQADGLLAAADLGPEELIVRSVGKDLVLTGGRPRGTLYAVYDFLDREVGCRWWAPGEQTVPRHRTLAVGPLDRRSAPALEYRETYWGHTGDGDYSARNRLNGPRHGLGGHHGRGYAEVGGVHSFTQYLHPERYFGEHPEWFSELDGKRTHASAQLCLTNPEMTAEFARNVLADVRAHHPGVTNVWVSQNDCDGYCQCANCRRIEKQEGTPAGPLILFVNAVADAVAAEFPDVAVNTLAYDWSQPPTRKLRPRPNVVVWLCTTGCTYSRPYTDPDNRVFRERLDGWARVCDRIYIWDYLTNFTAYMCPHPNLRTLGPNLHYFATHNVRGYFGQGAYSAPGAELAELRSWVLARLMWDPTLDAAKLIDEFLYGYYGRAGRHLRAYLDVLHDAVAASGENFGMQEQPVGREWLRAPVLAKAMEHLQQAVRSVEGNRTLSRRMAVAALPLQFVYLLRWDELQEDFRQADLPWPLEPDFAAAYQRFRQTMEANGITQFSEQNARDAAPLLDERAQVGLLPPPPGCANVPRERWVDLQNIGFNTRGENEDPQPVRRVVADPAASDGSAAWMPGDHARPLLLRQTWRIPLVQSAGRMGKPLKVFVSMRCELTGAEGPAFRCGVEGRGETFEVACADIPDGDYHTYEVGEFSDLRGWIHLWVSPAANGANVKAIWFDRAWLVAAK